MTPRARGRPRKSEADRWAEAAEAGALVNRRWKVVCIVPYELDLSHEEAIIEVSHARHTCDCGGAHRVELMEEP